MKVFVGPRTDPLPGGSVMEAARRLAGREGTVVSLRQLGVRDLGRLLSTAEIALLRQAFGREEPVIGYVCRGATVGGEAGAPPRGLGPEPQVGAAPLLAVAVTDHADLTWRSVLAGPNDEAVGPRFPSLTGVYAPDVVVDRLSGAEGMICRRGVVGGVRDDGALRGFEALMAADQGWPAVSAELVAPVVVAAHMGLRVAAVVVELS